MSRLSTINGTNTIYIMLQYNIVYLKGLKNRLKNYGKKFERRQYFIYCVYWCDVNEFYATGETMSLTNRQVVIITADASVWSAV